MTQARRQSTNDRGRAAGPLPGCPCGRHACGREGAIPPSGGSPQPAARWRDAAAKLIELQAGYQRWLDTLHQSLADTPTAETLRIVCELDLSAMEIDSPRGFGRDKAPKPLASLVAFRSRPVPPRGPDSRQKPPGGPDLRRSARPSPVLPSGKATDRRQASA